MGKLEKELKTKTRNTKIQKTILQVVATVGVLSVALLAPNALQMFKLFDQRKNRNFRQTINNSRRRLIKAGYLEQSGGLLRLTSRGERRIKEWERQDYKLPAPSRWDKKWRMLIFDIPEKRKLLRDKVRLTLHSIGFMRLQDSVWVYPYDCEEFITLLKAEFKIGKDLLYLIVDKIEYDRPLLSYFGLEQR